MIQVLENYPIASLNTFRDDYFARYFVQSNSPEAIARFLEQHSELSYLIIGGGSNLLFTENFDGILISPDFREKQVILEDEKMVIFQVGASLNFDKIVEYTTDKNWGGLENLSLIPGTVGAAPIQNIGAYGVEAKDCIFQVATFDLKNKTERIFTPEECQFGYRNSFFKQNPGQFLVTSVTFLLSKGNHHFHTEYGNIKEKLSNKPISLKHIRQTIINIRRNKLPDPNLYPNAGSFFKNPVVSASVFEKLSKNNSNLPYYKMNDNYKIPAAWLIDRCGFKGREYKRAGVFHNQPLVICKFSEDTTGNEIAKFSRKIQTTVFEKFGIKLEPEVTIF